MYFHYEDTALFAVDLIEDIDITLILNTGKRTRLRPKCLFIKNDSLYMRMGDETVKFSERGLLKISDCLLYEDNSYLIEVKNRKYKIPEI